MPQERLDPDRGGLPKQLVTAIREALGRGQLQPGDRLPPTRRLATELGVSRGTVVTAMELLIAEGLLESRVGSGTFVSKAAVRESSPRRTVAAPALPEAGRIPQPDVDGPASCRVDLRPCRPSVEEFPLLAWRRCLSWASSSRPTPDYGDPRGDEGLRREIADYLRRARGLAAEPEEILVTQGALQAMHLLASLYLDARSRVVLEDPCYPLARQIFARAAGGTLALEVDECGMLVDELPRSGSAVKLVYVTPSHQFPIGSRLSLERRHTLVDWAERNRAIIVEDDYDGEFRYDVPPLPPMAAMAPGLVVYCGTFSKTLFPGLRLGFAVADRRLIDALAAQRALLEYAPSAPLQDALRRFIAGGHFERHVHRMRRVYAAKRRKVAEIVAAGPLDARLSGLDSGLSALVQVDEEVSADALSRRAAERGILVPALSRYSFTKTSTIRRNALVVGYAEPRLEALEEGLRETLGATST